MSVQAGSAETAIDDTSPNPQAKTVDVQLDRPLIIAMLRDDPEFFIHFFLAEQASHTVPEFHKLIFMEMTHADVERLVLAIPRGHSKTTLAKLACVWYLLFSDFRFVLYVSGSHDLVVPYVNDIAAFFQTDNFIAVFGEVRWERKQDGNGVYKFRIPSLGNKLCILRGLGAGQRVRGVNVDNARPQLVVADDIEDDEDTKSALSHETMLNWWVGPFIKCLDQFKNKIIAAGNLTSKQSVLWKLLNGRRWRSYLMGCIRKDGTPLWPDMWPLDKLREDFLEYQDMGKTARWFAEMMNQPVAEGGGLIDSQHICYRPARTRTEISFGFITLDPAISRNSWADSAGLAAHGWVQEEQMWQIVELSLHKGLTVVDLFFKATEMAKRWGFRLIGIEAAAMQAVLEQTFNHYRLVYQMPQYEFVPVPHGNHSKTERLKAWCDMMSTANGRKPQYALTQGDFVATQQLLMYEPMKKDNKDDAIDTCAMGPIMTSRYLGKIMQQINDDLPQARLQSLARISPV